MEEPELRRIYAAGDEERDEVLLLTYEYRGRKIRLNVDTAAQASLMSRRVAGCRNLKKKRFTLLGLGGAEIRNYGSKRIKITTQEEEFEAEFQITDDISTLYDGIIGLDVLRELQAVVDVGRLEIVIGGKIYPLTLCTGGMLQKHARLASLHARSAYPMTLHVSRSQRISPGETKIIYAKVPKSGGEIILIDDEEESNREIKVVRTIAAMIKCGTSKYVPACVINTSSRAVELTKGFPLAQASYIKEEEIEAEEEIEEEIRRICGIQADKNIPGNKRRKDEKEDVKMLNEIRREIREKTSHITERRDDVIQLIEEYKDLFMTAETEFPKTNKIIHEIKTNCPRPIFQNPSRIPHHLVSVVREMVGDQMEKKILRRCSSQWNSRLVMVRKKTADGTVKYRATVDLRPLNAVTEDYYYQLPHISNSLETLQKSKWFTTLDVKSSFYHIPIAEESQEKTAFTFEGTQYCYRRLPMGAKNSSAVFQEFIDSVVGDMAPHAALTFIDDTIVHAENFERKMECLREVFSKFREANISLNLSKCEFFRREVEYLGYLVSEEGLKTNPRLVTKVKDAEIPITKTDVRAFLSLCNFYRKFVKNYAEIAHPLSELVKKGMPERVQWTPECNIAFKTLKTKMITSPILAYADFTKQFILETDASGYAVGAVLAQKGDDGREHVIGYSSKKLKPAQQRMSATERELFAIRFAVQHFKHYLLGAPRFIIRTDHKSLEWLHQMKTDNTKLARWSLELEAYNYDIEHRAGSKSGNVDGLSRMKCDDEDFNKQQRRINAVRIIEAEELKEEQRKDEECLKLQRKEGFITVAEILRHETASGPKIVLPRLLRHRVLQQHHDSKVSAHRGEKALTAAVGREFWWPTWKKDIREYVKKCKECAMRSRAGANKIPLQEFEETTYPFEMVAIDITYLPQATDGYTYILTIIDFFSRYLIMVPLRDQTAETVAQALVIHLFLKFGCPKRILSDNGKQFVGKLMKEICRLLDIDRVTCTVYSPAVNGRVERVHKTIKRMLSFYVSDKQDDWPAALPFVVSAYNSTEHSSTGHTPFEVVYGSKMRSPFEIDYEYKPQNHHVQRLDERLRQTWEEVRNLNHEAFLRYAKQHDKKAAPHKMKVGDQVLMKNVTIGKGLAKKLSTMWTGPYEIVDIKGSSTITIKKGANIQKIHANNLKLYQGDGIQRVVDSPSKSASTASSGGKKRGRPRTSGRTGKVVAEQQQQQPQQQHQSREAKPEEQGERRDRTGAETRQTRYNLRKR